MGKLFTTVGTFEWFLPTVYSKMLLEVVFEFKCLITIVAFVFSKASALVVTNHVALQSVHIREALVADLARLSAGRMQGLVAFQLLACRVGAAALAASEGATGAQW